MAIGTPLSIGTVQSKISEASTVLTTAAAAPAGSLIVVAAAYDDNGVISGVADSAGNSYALAQSAVNATNVAGAIYYAQGAALASGGTITISWSTQPLAKAVSAFAVSGIDPAAALDVVGAATGVGAPSVSTASSTTQNAVLTVGIVATDGPVENGFTQDASPAYAAPPVRVGTTGGIEGSNATLAGGYFIESAAGVKTYNPTIGGEDWAAVIATFKAPPTPVSRALADSGEAVGAAAAGRASAWETSGSLRFAKYSALEGTAGLAAIRKAANESPALLSYGRLASIESSLLLAAARDASPAVLGQASVAWAPSVEAAAGLLSGLSSDLEAISIAAAGRESMIESSLLTAAARKTWLAATGFVAASLSLSAVYGGVSLLVTAQDANPAAVVLRPDGKKLYVLGNATNAIYEYDLGTAWDVGSAVYSGASLSVTAQDANPVSMVFRPDGAKLYVLGNASNAVYEYDLPAAWDIGSAVYGGVSLLVTAQDENPVGIAFRPDGAKLYLLGNATNTVYEYALATAWAIGSATYGGVSLTVTAQDANPVGIALDADGTKLYVLGNATNEIYEYGATSGLGAAVYSGIHVLVTPQDANPVGFAFGDGGAKLYLMGNASNAVYEYDLETAWLSPGKSSGFEALVGLRVAGSAWINIAGFVAAARKTAWLADPALLAAYGHFSIEALQRAARAPTMSAEALARAIAAHVLAAEQAGGVRGPHIAGIEAMTRLLAAADDAVEVRAGIIRGVVASAENLAAMLSVVQHAADVLARAGAARTAQTDALATASRSLLTAGEVLAGQWRPALVAIETAGGVARAQLSSVAIGSRLAPAAAVWIEAAGVLGVARTAATDGGQALIALSGESAEALVGSAAGRSSAAESPAGVAADGEIWVTIDGTPYRATVISASMPLCNGVVLIRSQCRS
jgi:hypothetical protein